MEVYRMKKMIITKRFIKTLAAIGAATMLLMPFTACKSSKNLSSGFTWNITETTSLKKLNIAEGATIVAPEGKSLTMTVDGVETPIAAGSYKGKIALTITDDILVDKNNKTYQFRTGIYVSDGKYVPEKSVAASVSVGTVSDTSANDIKITSVGDNFNGIIVTGENKSSYSIINPVINMTGNGRNDFAGFGAAIKTDGKAEVTIDNARINNTGAVRPAIWVGGDSITKINNADIETHSGTLPSDYSFSWVKGSMAAGDNFMEVPWMLGCVGNTRATIVMANGQAYYNNSHIKAYGWGALSTDQTSSDAILYATNCIIETVESGYGAFSDGNVNTYSGCTFNVADYALIMQRGSAHFTDGTVVNSQRLGAMSYGGSNILTIDKGTVFNTKKAAIQIKGGSPIIVVDTAQLNSESGVIFQAMLQDDPDMVKSSRSGGMPGGSGGAPGAGSPGGSAQGAGGAAPGGAVAGGAPGAGASGGMPGGGMPGAAGGGPKVTFKDVTLNGDIITSMTTEGDVDVTLEKAIITGAITTSIAEHAKGPNGEELTERDDTSLYKIIGEVKDTYSATNDKYGMRLSLDKDSKWVVDETSYLTNLTIAEGASIAAPEGFKVTMTVNGAAKAIKAGEYKGKIVLSVTKS
jgi:hypothetical protein